MRFLLPALTALFLLPAPAQAEECPRGERPSVRVSVRQDTPQMFTTYDIRSLDGMRNNRESAGRSSEHVPLGLARAQVTYQMSLQAKIAPLRNGNVCVSLSELEIEYAFSDTAIYIASEIPIGTCAFSKVEEHERRHVAVDSQLLREWEFRLRQEAEYAAQNVGVVWSHDQASALEQIKSRLSASIKQSAETMMGERNRRQAQVDTRMEYDRISRACNGDIQRIVRQALGY